MSTPTPTGSVTPSQSAYYAAEADDPAWLADYISYEDSNGNGAGDSGDHYWLGEGGDLTYEEARARSGFDTTE